jgi:hypothetical protein
VRRPHFAKKGFEALTDEADATKISEIRILSGPAQAGDATKDYKRFQGEMKALGIRVEWRIVQTADRDWHDRFIVSRDAAWNVPPLNTIYKGDSASSLRRSARLSRSGVRRAFRSPGSSCPPEGGPRWW